MATRSPDTLTNTRITVFKMSKVVCYAVRKGLELLVQAGSERDVFSRLVKGTKSLDEMRHLN